MILETKRLILRKPESKDWKDLVEGLNDREVRKNMAGIPSPYTKKDALIWLNKTKKNWKQKKKTAYNFHIVLKAENKVIGGIGIHDINEYSKFGTTGSWINAKYRRKGYITEAKIAINDFTFNKLRLRRLNSSIIEYNKASRKVQEKMGYKLEGIRRKYMKMKSNGKIIDLCFYGLLKEDWIRRRKKLIK